MTDTFGTVRKYKATYHPNPDSIHTFHGITKNFSQAKDVFDELLTEARLFNCLNNDIDTDDPDYFDSDEYKQLTAYWQKFYFYYFPVPSEFELRHGIRNRFQYMDEYRKWQTTQNHFQMLVFSGLVISCFVVVAFSYYQMYKRATGTHKLLPKSGSLQNKV